MVDLGGALLIFASGALLGVFLGRWALLKDLRDAGLIDRRMT